MSPSVTLIVPVFNEQDNIQPLYQQLRPVMDRPTPRQNAFRRLWFAIDGWSSSSSVAIMAKQRRCRRASSRLVGITW
jgi:hypothetical protein